MARISSKNKAIQIQTILDDLFPNPQIPLVHKDPYTLLIAVLLSAQCTDLRVNKISPELFKLADNPFDMMQIPVDVIQEIIKPCGLSGAKSKAISNLSKILVNEYNGMVPDGFEQLEALPGVGHKTASVVMCQAFGHPAFPVDTHIHRLARRWGLSNGKNVIQTEFDLKKIFLPEVWNKIHLQMIYYGRLYCPARSHNLENCKICQLYNPTNKN